MTAATFSSSPIAPADEEIRLGPDDDDDRDLDLARAMEIGATWKRQSKAGGEYRPVRIDDPLFAGRAANP